jgi:hypothetical protein
MLPDQRRKGAGLGDGGGADAADGREGGGGQGMAEASVAAGEERGPGVPRVREDEYGSLGLVGIDVGGRVEEGKEEGRTFISASAYHALARDARGRTSTSITVAGLCEVATASGEELEVRKKGRRGSVNRVWTKISFVSASPFLTDDCMLSRTVADLSVVTCTDW